jgi:sterol 3beta-glucosyltransferase
MPSGWTPPEDLCRFLDAGPPPVFVGLGSTNPGDAERLSGVVAAALRRAGQRGVIQAGWAELSASGDDMITIGDVPHEWLFPRMAVVVHAAGAGTTAAGLRAGVPSVPIPVTRDGPFWSYRLTTLGVSPGAIRFKKLTVDRLAVAVREAVTNPVYTRRATELAADLATEDGSAQVLATVTNSPEPSGLAATETPLCPASARPQPGAPGIARPARLSGGPSGGAPAAPVQISGRPWRKNWVSS